MSVNRKGESWLARWVDHEGRRRSRSFRTKREAEAFERRTRAELAAGVALTGGRETFAAYAERWAARRVWRDSTRAVHAAHMRGLLGRQLGPLPLERITRGDVEELVAAGFREGYAHSTVEAYLRRASTVLAAAVADRRLAANPALGVKLPPRDRRAEDVVAVLTPEQYEALRGRLSPPYAALAALCLGAGLRASEAAALAPEHVVGGRLQIDRQLTGATPEGRPVYGPPKTPSSRRSVPIVGSVAEVLDQLPLVDYDLHPLTRQRRGHAWRAAASGLELPDAARGWHALRHTFVSRQLAAGTPVAVVSRVIGHRTVAETLETYAHMLPGADQALPDVGV